MHIERSSLGLTVQTPAKLNLFFEVLAKREDGYHEIETLMCPIDLYDTLSFSEEESGQVQLRCEMAFGSSSDGCDHCGSSVLETLPLGSDNLVMRAVELLRRRCGIQRGATISLTKRIPLAAGLGGGSSDAAAALVAANQGWRLGRSANELAEIGAELGSDIPFFLAGMPAVCRGRGERVQSVSARGSMHFVVVRPPVGLSTAEVYRHCKPATKRRPLDRILAAFIEGNPSAVGRQLWNRLQSTATEMTPWMERLRYAFSQQDVLGHQMSGSGTSYFGLCRHRRHARRVAQRLMANGVGNVFVVQSCPTNWSK